MSEHDFISLGIPLGTSRLTISATTVPSMTQFLNELNEEDPIEGVSAISDVLDSINTINAAVNLKMPQFAPQESAPARPAASPDGGFTPGGYGGAAPAASATQTCTHGVMTYREGTTKSGPNVGKPYQAYFCPAPRGTNQCKPVFAN